MLRETDAQVADVAEGELSALLEAANDRVADELREENDKLLDQVLYTSSMHMRNGFSLSDH